MGGENWRRKRRKVRREAPMVGWFEPAELARTGVQIVVSSLFGERADFRAMEALSTEPLCIDCRGADPAADLWLDYVADVGDGFAPTYAVARLLGEPSLTVSGEGRAGLTLPRGRVLVMGGDEVYPTPTPDRYEERLVGPYAAALPFDHRDTDETRPELFAIPGNHDWYDGLGAFMSLFGSGRRIGNWVTRQKRSYFALRLPHHTWLIAVDVQLGSDIDHAQLEAFADLPDILPGDRVILCSAEPDWQYRALDTEGESSAPRHLDELRRRLEKRGAAVVLQLAGDQHHYRRQSDKAMTRHLVTCGGGGAFLHPTHTNPPGPVRMLGRTYTCDEGHDYPPRERSRGICWHNWIFPIKNPWFGTTTAVVYLILGLVMPTPREPDGPWYLRGSMLLIDALSLVAESPASMAWLLLVIGGFFAFTDTHKRWYRYLAGLGHGTAHLACALAGALVALRARGAVHDGLLGFFGVTLGLGHHPWAIGKLAMVLSFFAYAGALALWGYLFGALLFGAYLWLSVFVFGRHGNEAFSAIKHEGFRSFLRIAVRADSIDVHVIGVDRVPPARAWEHRDGAYHPKPGAELAPRLIDCFSAKTQGAPGKATGSP